MSVKIIIDSTANVRKDFEDKFVTVPLTVNFGTESFADGVEIDNNTLQPKGRNGEYIL